jgi:hypothetical protein
MIATLFLAAAVLTASPEDVRIVNRANGHIFVTLHPDGTYTCNPYRDAKEILSSDYYGADAIVAVYFALCGKRR